jgi:hypothetical protein
VYRSKHALARATYPATVLNYECKSVRNIVPWLTVIKLVWHNLHFGL